MTRCQVPLIALAALCLDGYSAKAQDGPSTCWVARPAPACRAFVVTSFGPYTRLGSGTGAPTRLLADWGLMVNVGRRDAVGLSYAASVDIDAGFEAGPAVRYRRWLGGRSAVDVTFGELTLSGNHLSGHSLFGMVKYSPASWFGVAVRRSGFGTTAGIELGGPAGFVVTLAAPIIALVAFAAHPPSI